MQYKGQRATIKTLKEDTKRLKKHIKKGEQNDQVKRSS